MGLIKREMIKLQSYRIFWETRIIFGDMDFKVAGSVEGITAIQMDIKINWNIRFDIMEKALALGKKKKQNFTYSEK